MPMRRRRRGADIDITPLIDILFMLIIFFVLATSFIQGRMPVELPQAAGAKPTARDPLLVTLTRGGEVYWGDRPGPVPSGDIAGLARENAGKREILVAGDRGVSYGEVVGLLDELQRAGVERLSLALQGGARQGDVAPVGDTPVSIVPKGHVPR